MTEKKTKKFDPRSLGRALAFQARFQEEINPQDDSETDWDELCDGYCEETNLALSSDDREKAIARAREIFDGARIRRDEIDRLLDAALDKRTLKQTNRVDRNILRVGAYEIRFIKTPKAIVISEAIELVLKFGERSSIGFVNGVLDRIDSVSLDEKGDDPNADSKSKKG